jgi:serine/alanine adding enzyme
MPLDIAVEEASVNDAAWDRFVVQQPDANGYHLMGWRRVIESAFGHPTFYLKAGDETGTVRGVLPLVYLSSRMFGRFLVSLPFVNYGGVVASDPAARGALLDRAVRIAKRLGAGHIELRHDALGDLSWPSKQHKVSMRLELPESFSSLWSGFAAKLRSQIRRAEKESMSFKIGGEELVDDFYEIFSRNMRDLGTPIYGRSFFHQILRQFSDSAHVAVVYLRQLPVAAGFLYGFRTLLEIPWASSDRRYNHLAPNMLLYKSVLEYACEQGYRVFDFGRSTPDSGTYRFKQQWGAAPVELYWHYWLADGRPLPDLSPSNPKYRLATSLWRRLPLGVSRRLGPSIVKFIP